MGWVARMTPLPDADKKSPRVYTLTQNTDLENLAFATMQSIGQPISIEEMSEDELRRLVLVNLARLSVKGEWSGLLTAGGGDSGYGVLLPETTTGTYDGFEITAMAPWGTQRSATQNLNIPAVPTAFPFVAPESGDLSEVEIWINTTTASSTLVIAFYEDDTTNHVPGDLLGYVTIDTATSTGAVSQTSFSSTVTLTEGTQYWCAYAKGTSAYASIKGIQDDHRMGLGIANSPINTNNAASYGTTDWISPNVPADDIGSLTQYTGGTLATIVIKY